MATTLPARGHRAGLLLAGLLLAGGCAAPAGQATPAGPGTPPASGASVASAELATVYRSATCECCVGHERHLRDAGFRVRSVVVDDVAAVKQRLGVPDTLTSCHTTVVGDYFVEGHVPADVMVELLAERPAVDGIALAGMPAGSPGMAGEQVEAFVVHAVDGGEISVYAVR